MATVKNRAQEGERVGIHSNLTSSIMHRILTQALDAEPTRSDPLAIDNPFRLQIAKLGGPTIGDFNDAFKDANLDERNAVEADGVALFNAYRTLTPFNAAYDVSRDYRAQDLPQGDGTVMRAVVDDIGRVFFRDMAVPLVAHLINNTPRLDIPPEATLHVVSPEVSAEGWSKTFGIEENDLPQMMLEVMRESNGAVMISHVWAVAPHGTREEIDEYRRLLQAAQDRNASIFTPNVGITFVTTYDSPITEMSEAELDAANASFVKLPFSRKQLLVFGYGIYTQDGAMTTERERVVLTRRDRRRILAERSRLAADKLSLDEENSHPAFQDPSGPATLSDYLGAAYPQSPDKELELLDIADLQEALDLLEQAE